MSAVKKLVSTIALSSLSLSVMASVAPIQEGSSEYGCMALIAMGFIGLVAARKHIKSSAV